jgi:heme/copper-type cytochrome/quinol oxidase subunit 2
MHLRIADAIFWIAVACCAVAQLAIVRSAFVSPATPAGSGSADSNDSHAPASTARRASEIAWAVLPGVALVVLFFYTWSAIHPSAAMTHAAALTPNFTEAAGR